MGFFDKLKFNGQDFEDSESVEENDYEYEYEEERWIHRFDTNISEQFVSDKIVDISRIGYQIEGQAPLRDPSFVRLLQITN